MMSIYKPPTKIPSWISDGVFLAGSIEMGTAENWQEYICNEFTLDNSIFNPRRDDWDSSWEQSIHNSNFREQAEWELDALDQASLIILHFVPDTKSPISLLELGLYASSEKLLVSCPQGFWRRGNVEIVCKKYDIPFHETIDDVLETIYLMSI